MSRFMDSFTPLIDGHAPDIAIPGLPVGIVPTDPVVTPPVVVPPVVVPPAAAVVSAFTARPALSGTPAAGQRMAIVSGALVAGRTSAGYRVGIGEGLGATIYQGTDASFVVPADYTSKPLVVTQYADNGDTAIGDAVRGTAGVAYSIDFTALANGTLIPDKQVNGGTATDGVPSFFGDATGGGLPGWWSASSPDPRAIGNGAPWAKGDDTCFAISGGRMVRSHSVTTDGVASYGIGRTVQTGDYQLDFSVPPGLPRFALSLSNQFTGSRFQSSLEFTFNGPGISGVADNVLPPPERGYDCTLIVRPSNNTTEFLIDGISVAVVDSSTYWGLERPNFIFRAIGGFDGQPFLTKLSHGDVQPAQKVTVVKSTVVESPNLGQQRVRFTGNWTGTKPTGFDVQSYAPNGALVNDFAPATVASITTDASGARGTFDVTLSQDQQRSLTGNFPTHVLRKSNAHDDQTSSAKARAEYRLPKKMGGNICWLGGTNYYNSANPFKDWRMCSFWQISGGPYHNQGGRDAQGNDLPGGWGDPFAMYPLMDAGIIDADNNLLKWPDGATSVRIAMPWTPADSELGQRRMKVPAGQKLTFGAFYADKIKLISENVATGEYIYDIQYQSAADRRFGIQGLGFSVDKDTFRPWNTAGGWSMRKVADTTTDIITDELVALISKFQTFRLMDELYANGGGLWVRPWDKRARFSWSAEAVVELVNRTGATPWITPGFNVTPEILTAYFAYFKAHFAAGIYPIVDLFNEVWGGIFTLPLAMGILSYSSGRAMKDAQGRWGYGLDKAVPPEKIFGDYADGVFFRTQGVSKAIKAGDYVSNGSNGKNGCRALYRAKHDNPAGTLLPSSPPGWDGATMEGVSDANWEWVANANTNAQVAHSGYYGTKAVKAAFPGTKVYFNLQPFAGPQDGGGGFAYPCLMFPMTAGGSERWADLFDGCCVAPYAGWGNWEHTVNGNVLGGPEYIATVPAGAQRQQALGDQYLVNVNRAGDMVQSALATARTIADLVGRQNAQIDVTCYEQGMDMRFNGGGAVGCMDSESVANYSAAGALIDQSHQWGYSNAVALSGSFSAGGRLTVTPASLVSDYGDLILTVKLVRAAGGETVLYADPGPRDGSAFVTLAPTQFALPGDLQAGDRINVYQKAVSANFRADFLAFRHSDRAKQLSMKLHTACFNGGANVVETYCLGFVHEDGGFVYSHTGDPTDTTSALIAADIAIADACRAGTLRLPAV